MDTCADVNIIPVIVYKLVFNEELKKLVPSTLEIGTYTSDTVNITGSSLFYLVHPDTMKLQEVPFHVAQNDGSVLLSCNTTLVLGMIQPCTRLDYLPPRASLITSSVDHPKKIKRVSVHSSRKEVSTRSPKQVVTVPKLVTSKEQILQSYPDVLRVLNPFKALYHIQLDPSITPRQIPCRPIMAHLKEAFKQEIDKMLKAGVLKPVHGATP